MTEYTFGKIQLSVKGLGLFTGEEKIRKIVETLTQEELKEANKAAWAMRRKSGDILSRVANFTIYGSSGYDSASLDYRVSKAVTLETWKRMQRK